MGGADKMFRDASRPAVGEMMRQMMLKSVILILSVLLLVAPVRAQSTGPSHAGFDPNASLGGHYHEGELGD